MSSPIGVFGATSFVGRALLPRLAAAGCRVIGVSRRELAEKPSGPGGEKVSHWVALCPIWALPEHFDRLEAAGARRLVALSSTSRFTKSSSGDAADRETAAKLATAEESLLTWAARQGVSVTILRPTLIYDGRHDRNVATIAAWIRRWGFFPVVGPARGLRQPVHVDDVAAACMAALTGTGLEPAYDLSGGEVLSYRNMVERVFKAIGRPVRIVSLPRWLVCAGVPVLRAMGRYRHVTTAMFDRMSDDMVFDHAAAARDLGFAPRPFVLPSEMAGGHS